MQTENTDPRAGWTSASSAESDNKCPGRHLAQKGIPEQPSPDSKFGDQIHQALFKGSPEGLSAAQESIYDSVLAIEQKLCVKFFGPDVEGKTPNPVKEKRYWATHPSGLKHSAQLDRVHRRGTRALIIDVKSLAGEVAESPRNLQLRDQACLYDYATSAITEIGVAIVQPLATHSPELCVYTPADLTQAKNELWARVTASNNPDAPRIPGPIQCKFCRAKGVCVEYQKWASAMVPAPKSLVDVPVSQWSPEQRVQFCDEFDVAQKWLNDCWQAMETGAKADPNFVPGYGLKDNSPRGKIVNLQKVFDRSNVLGVPLADFLEKSTITKEDLTELTRKFSKKKGKELESAVKQVIANDVQLSQVKQSLKKL
jgi:Protein of unknown function (DUF2800)